MTVFVHAFKMIPADATQPSRLCRLDWIVTNDNGQLCRGFSFEIEPDNWLMDESTATLESSSTFDRMHVIGHPAAKIIQKFFDDLDSCQTMVAFDADDVIAMLTFEAKIYHCGAKRKIEQRVSLNQSTTETFDFQNGGTLEMMRCYNKILDELPPITKLQFDIATDTVNQ